MPANLNSPKEEMLSRLVYVAERQLFAVITGDCGTGKATTIHRFKESLDAMRFLVMYLADSRLTPREYVKRHLAYAGADHDIISDGAVEEIYRFSSGAARLVNKHSCNVLNKA